jgi:hypothetical protein
LKSYDLMRGYVRLFMEVADKGAEVTGCVRGDKDRVQNAK